MKKLFLLVKILSLFFIQCGNFVTGSNNTDTTKPPVIDSGNYTWNDFKGRYSVSIDTQSTMDIVLFDTGYIQIIMKKIKAMLLYQLQVSLILNYSLIL